MVPHPPNRCAFDDEGGYFLDWEGAVATKLPWYAQVSARIHPHSSCPSSGRLGASLRTDRPCFHVWDRRVMCVSLKLGSYPGAVPLTT